MEVDNESIHRLTWKGGEKPHPVPVMFAPKKGGAAKQLALPQTGTNGIRLDGDSGYWITPGGIKKPPKTGGEGTLMCENPTQGLRIGLAQDAENFYYAQKNDRGYSAQMKLTKKG